KRACYLALPKYEILARDLDRLGSDPYVNGNAAGTQALEGRSNCLTPGSGYQNNLGAAERLESFCGIGSGTGDIVVRTELLGQFRRAGATSNRHHFESHVSSVLHT